MPFYEAILFDFDGVLVDSEPIHYQCWTEILAPFGIDLKWSTFAEHCIGITDRKLLEFLASRADPPLDVEKLMLEYPRKKELFRSRMGAVGVATDIHELVTELRPDYKLAVVTSSHLREVSPVLELSGLLPLLDTIVHGGEVKHHKPDPEPYLLALERLQVKRALAIEDSKAGIAAARAAGCDVVEIPASLEVSRRVREALTRAVSADR